MLRTTAMKMTAASLMLSVALSAPAAAAARTSSAQPVTLSPWVALSALGSSGSRAALCGSSSASAAAGASTSAQTAAPGCVLPVVDAPAPVVQPVEPVPAAAVPAAARGFSVLPLLLGLAGVAALAALLLSGDGDDDINIDPEPITTP